MTFSEACRQTLVLYESADSDSCSSGSDESVLQSRVDVVNAACCEQGGVNTCVGGAPQTCILGLHRAPLAESSIRLPLFVVPFNADVDAYGLMPLAVVQATQNVQWSFCRTGPNA